MEFYNEVPAGQHPDTCTIHMYFVSPKESFLKEVEEIYDTENLVFGQWCTQALYSFEKMLGVEGRCRDNYRAFFYKKDPSKLLIVLTDDLEKDDMLNVMLINKRFYEYKPAERIFH